MDMFLGDLISELEKREKPTLLIAYGDHQIGRAHV